MPATRDTVTAETTPTAAPDSATTVADSLFTQRLHDMMKRLRQAEIAGTLNGTLNSDDYDDKDGRDAV